MQLARDVALDDAHALLSRLEADKALLPFDYTIQLEPAGTSRARAVRSVNVTVGGRGATATSGMAVATIDVMSLAWIDSEVAATLVAGRRMRPDEAESFRKWPGEVSVVEPLHDLRDMHPFVSDEGHTLQATRQSRATELPAVVASIVSFIEANECDQVEVAYLGDAPWG
ncbi:MAG: hypothetical protein JNL79_13000 [Myxococcales bacterium]|nr:hypothetical protein [Myxococcales bacterium]